MLALAMMHVIFRERLEDRAYMAECTTGAARAARACAEAGARAGAAAEITGIAAERIEALAKSYARCAAAHRPARQRSG